MTQGREWQAWVRRALLVIPGAIVVLALANVFGQHPATTSASAVGASVSVNAPTSIRGGLIWQAPVRHPRQPHAPARTARAELGLARGKHGELDRAAAVQ